MNPFDCRLEGCELYLLPIETRVPLKFGAEVLSSVTCARVRVEVVGHEGNRAGGWGETPLSVQWVWPSPLPYSERYAAILDFTKQLASDFGREATEGHPFEVGADFLQAGLASARDRFNQRRGGEPLPYLAALVAFSAYDLALHDAYGRLLKVPTYETYGPPYLTSDLATWLEPREAFAGKYPRDFFRTEPADRLTAWHLVGGLDPLTADDLTGSEPDDGHPNLLADWIRRDGLKCLKVKLRGNDLAWDYERLVRVGRLGLEQGVTHLTADFNCTVTDPAYVVEVLDRLQRDETAIYESLLYVEQPFPYELEHYPVDVHEVASRKPLFLDESAHDWRMVEFGSRLGWNGVALKTCKTQTGALLSAAWAQQAGMQLMVQDLTNPMLAQMTHALLAAHVPTIMGIETNGMQFYPDASLPEATVHPGLYQRRNGELDLSSLRGPGFGLRVDEIERTLPPPAVAAGSLA
jgi:L-alanine-DL-glutamate epimerase-like enolase superfamily enzyme